MVTAELVLADDDWPGTVIDVGGAVSDSEVDLSALKVGSRPSRLLNLDKLPGLDASVASIGAAPALSMEFS